MITKIYITKKTSYFDENTICILKEDFGNGTGLFLGYKNGEVELQVCNFNEFEENYE